MSQPFVGTFQKGLLRLGQDRRTGVLEFLEQLLARLDQQTLLLVEIGGLFLERRKLGAQRPVAAPQFFHRRLVLATGIAQFPVQRIRTLGAHARIFQIDDCLAEFLVEFLRARLALAMTSLPVLEWRGAETMTEEIAQREAEHENDDGDEGRIHGRTLRRTEGERQRSVHAINSLRRPCAGRGPTDLPDERKVSWIPAFAGMTQKVG